MGRAFDEAIDTAAVEIGTVVLQVEPRIAVFVTNRFPDLARLIRLGSSSTHAWVQQATNEQRIVTNLFRIQSETWPRASKRFSGSRCNSSGVTWDDCWNASEVTSNRIKPFVSQFDSWKCTAK